MPAVAQDLTISVVDGALVTEMAGHRVTIPAPSWTRTAGASEQQSPFVFNRVDTGIESLLFVPPGETIVSWTHMMGVLAVNRPGYTAAAHIASIVQPMQQSCAQGQAVISELPAASPDHPKPVLLMCGRYRPSGGGPRGCAAGIIVAAVRQSPQGAMKVYDEWCTGAFDARDQSTWPVPPNELLQTVGLLETVAKFEPLTPAQ